jgi:hypothetical protein
MTVQQIVDGAKTRWKEFPNAYNGNEEVVHKYIELIKESLPSDYKFFSFI